MDRVTQDPGGDLEWLGHGLAFAYRLRLIRKHRGLTQEQLAHQSGVHRNTVSNLERNVSRDDGCADPHLSTVFALARTLRVPPALLIPEVDALVQRRSRETADDLAWSAVEVDISRRLSSGHGAGPAR